LFRFEGNIQNHNIKPIFFDVGVEVVEPDEEGRVTTISLIKLRRLGYELIQIPVNNLQRWFPSQRFRYFVVPSRYAKNFYKMQSIPREHSIEYDTIEKKCRCVGKYSTQSGAQDWI
jgi:hypothetical protein